MANFLKITTIVLASSLASLASADTTVQEKTSIYSDDHGVDVQRIKLNMAHDRAHGGIVSSSSYSLTGSVEEYEKEDISDDEYMQEHYGGNKKTKSGASLSLSQTWNKLTDTRILGSYSDDKVVRTQTGGIGVSHWFWKETLQVGMDVSRTVVEQPEFEVLGADSDALVTDPVVTSNGVTLSVKNLATPTTVTNASWTHVESTDRPPGNVWGGGIKQFIPATSSAVHLDVARAENRGRITRRTTYGEVDAWIAELAFLQTLWKGAWSRAGYRYYREDEVTTVDQEEYLRGSDLISLAFAQTFTKKEIDSLRAPVVVEFSAARYATNELEDGRKLAANIFEAGIQARF